MRLHRFVGSTRIIPLSLIIAATISMPAFAASLKSLHVFVDRSHLLEGQCVVLTAHALKSDGKPAAGLKVRAWMNGKPWCTYERTSASGVARLILPIPEVGNVKLAAKADGVTSPKVIVHVRRRKFHIITDPNHLIGMEYETWWGPGYAKWNHAEAVPILGHYSSLDPRIIKQQALWFDRMGINFVELDWTNNLVHPFPDAVAKECMAATRLVFRVYRHMRQHPKIVLLMGPEHNLWLGRKTPYTGPWFRKQVNYVYRHFIDNPRDSGMYLHYLGKPLLNFYLNGPRSNRLPKIVDPRFTIRYVGAWLQTTREDRYGAWSWYDQKPTPTYFNGKVEALTVASGYPATNPPYWRGAHAGAKNDGLTYRDQWRVADHDLPHFLFLCQWNEFAKPDQFNINLSNDMEPTIMTEMGSHRPSGWGFYYTLLTRMEIARYHRIIAQTADRTSTKTSDQ